MRHIFMPPPAVVSREHYVFRLYVRPSVRPLTFTSHDAICPYLVEGFQWNLALIFLTSVGFAEKVFKVTGQRSRS